VEGAWGTLALHTPSRPTLSRSLHRGSLPIVRPWAFHGETRGDGCPGRSGYRSLQGSPGPSGPENDGPPISGEGDRVAVEGCDRHSMPRWSLSGKPRRGGVGRRPCRPRAGCCEHGGEVAGDRTPTESPVIRQTVRRSGHHRLDFIVRFQYGIPHGNLFLFSLDRPARP
jgi:hypothetical protein